MAQNLIEEGKAFVDDTSREQMQSERMAGIDSKCRNNTVAENISYGTKCLLHQIEDYNGPSKNLNLMEWDNLWSINKKIIDPVSTVCPRHTAIVKEGRVLLTLSNGPETPFVRKIPKHKRYDGAGVKDTTFTKEIWIEQVDAKAIADAEAISGNLYITLMDWGNASNKEIKKDSDGNVTELNGVLPLEGSVYKTTKLKLTWLPEINELSPLALVEFGYLLKKKSWATMRN
nr:glutamate--tRNA ligase, cytoplasmic [Tanacetum cinerariifolium]